MNINIYNPYVRSELELYHHGIRGQRWGKRNGPPYPLGAGDHSASEKKAGWRKSLADGIEELKTRKLLKSVHKFTKMISSRSVNVEKVSKLKEKIRKQYLQRMTTDEIKTLVNKWEEYDRQDALFETAADKHVLKYKDKGTDFRRSLLRADETENYTDHFKKYPDKDLEKQERAKRQSFMEAHDYAKKVTERVTNANRFDNPRERNIAWAINNPNASNSFNSLNKELERRNKTKSR